LLIHCLQHISIQKRENLKITSVQFKNKSGDKDYDIFIIQEMSAKATAQGSEGIAFHECSLAESSFARNLSLKRLLEVAESVPSSPSTQRLNNIAQPNNIPKIASIFKRDNQDKIYSTYICVDSTGLLTKYRKVHTFISNYLSAGNKYLIFDYQEWKTGILICCDNNVIEKVRFTTLLST
jgi:predicted amidohydrolase